MSLLKRTARKIARTEFAQKAIKEKADLSLLKERPSARIVFGMFLIALSYLIGWPAVAFFGVLAIYFSEPLIAIVGGPVIYGISHLVFIAGVYLAGVQYAYILLRWATRKALERVLGEEVTAEQGGEGASSV